MCSHICFKIGRRLRDRFWRSLDDKAADLKEGDFGFFVQELG